MLTAEYPSDPEKGIWTEVQADAYSAQVHGRNLRCGDPLCNADVFFRRPTTSHGGSASRRAHFAAKSRAEHEANRCSSLSDYDEEHNSVSFSEAVEHGHPIILNLNAQAGHPLYKTFGRAATYDQADTRYNQFRRQYVHASVSLRSLDDYIKARNKIRNLGPDVLKRTWVAHCQDLRRIEGFNIGRNQDKFRQLISAMTDPKECGASQDTIVGFPRFLTFQPTKNEITAHRTGSTYANGNAVILMSQNGASLILLNRLTFPLLDMRAQLMAYDKSELIATPTISMRQFESARGIFERGKNAYAHISWNIITQDQFRPTEKAKHIAPQPELFEFA